MKSLTRALRSREGRMHLLAMAVGILIACVGGAVTQSSDTLCDIVVIVGAVISMVGAQQFCRLLIKLRDEE